MKLKIRWLDIGIGAGFVAASYLVAIELRKRVYFREMNSMSPLVFRQKMASATTDSTWRYVLRTSAPSECSSVQLMQKLPKRTRVLVLNTIKHTVTECGGQPVPIGSEPEWAKLEATMKAGEAGAVMLDAGGRAVFSSVDRIPTSDLREFFGEFTAEQSPGPSTKE